MEKDSCIIKCPLKTQEKGWFNDGISQFGARCALRVDVDVDGATAAAADAATAQWRAQSNLNVQTKCGRQLTQGHLWVDVEVIIFEVLYPFSVESAAPFSEYDLRPVD